MLSISTSEWSKSLWSASFESSDTAKDDPPTGFRFEELKVKSAFSLFGVPLGGVGTINPVGGADDGKSISEVAICALTGTRFFGRALGVQEERAAVASEIACEVFSCPIIA